MENKISIAITEINRILKDNNLKFDISEWLSIISDEKWLEIKTDNDGLLIIPN